MPNTSIPSVESTKQLLEMGKRKPARTVFTVKLAGSMKKFNDAEVEAACAAAMLKFVSRWQGTCVINVQKA